VGGLLGALTLPLLYAVSFGRWFSDKRLPAIPIGVDAAMGLSAGTQSDACRKPMPKRI